MTWIPLKAVLTEKWKARLNFTKTDFFLFLLHQLPIWGTLRRTKFSKLFITNIYKQIIFVLFSFVLALVHLLKKEFVYNEEREMKKLMKETNH